MSRRGNIKGEKVWVKGKERGREKEKNEKIIIMTISKDNKWMVLSLLKVKDDKLFP